MRRYFHKTCSFHCRHEPDGVFFRGCSPLQEPESEPVRISLDEATDADSCGAPCGGSDLDPEVAFTLEERTTDELGSGWGRRSSWWGRLPGRIPERPRLHLIIDKQVHRLGMAFGGYGLTSMAVTDLDQDQQPELFYTYSWGSGLHRAHLAVSCRSRPGHLWGRTGLSERDLILEKVDDRTLLVQSRRTTTRSRMVFSKASCWGRCGSMSGMG